MNDFLEFSELRTSPAYVRDPKSGELVRMLAIQITAFRPVGHPQGETAHFPVLHVSEHSCRPFLEKLAKDLAEHFRVPIQIGSSDGDSEGPLGRLQ